MYLFTVHTKNHLIFLITDFNPFLSIETVHNTNHEDGPHCKAVFSLQNSAVCGLQFANLGGKLAVGYENGQVRSSMNLFPFKRKWFNSCRFSC